MAIFSSSPSSWLALPATWYDSETGRVAQGGSADAEAVAEQNRGLLLLPCHASASVYSYGVTRRCQERRYLLRFKKDRRQYLQRLREAIARYRISVLNYMPTSNHVHLLVWCDHARDLSAAMQYVSGSIAQDYNRRKKRQGAFWAGRFRPTLIQPGHHLCRGVGVSVK